MKRDSLRRVMEVLHGGNVRFLVAGGLAVNAHGLLRFTADVDIVVQLVPENIQKTFAALGTIGYRPIVPVTPQQFADIKTREGWIRDKGMRVLQFRSDEHRTVPVDVFVSEPFPFDEEYERSLCKPLTNNVTVRFVSLETLIRMKLDASRPQDLADVDALRGRRNQP